MTSVYALWPRERHRPTRAIVAYDLKIEGAFWVGRDHAGVAVAAYAAEEISTVRRLSPDEIEATFGPAPYGFEAEMQRQSGEMPWRATIKYNDRAEVVTGVVADRGPAR